MQPTNPTNDKTSEVSPAILIFARKHGYETAKYNRRWDNFKCYVPILQKGRTACIGLPRMILEDVKTGDIRMSSPKESFDMLKEHSRAHTNEANIKQVEQIVEQAWPTATTEKREKLIKLMIAFESPKWVEYVLAAEKNQIAGSDILLKYRDKLVDAGARGIADHGTMIINFDAHYYQNQVEALMNYLE